MLTGQIGFELPNSSEQRLKGTMTQQQLVDAAIPHMIVGDVLLTRIEGRFCKAPYEATDYGFSFRVQDVAEATTEDIAALRKAVYSQIRIFSDFVSEPVLQLIQCNDGGVALALHGEAVLIDDEPAVEPYSAGDVSENLQRIIGFVPETVQVDVEKVRGDDGEYNWTDILGFVRENYEPA